MPWKYFWQYMYMVMSTSVIDVYRTNKYTMSGLLATSFMEPDRSFVKPGLLPAAR